MLRRQLLQSPFFASVRQQQRDKKVQRRMAALIKIEPSDDEGYGKLEQTQLERRTRAGFAGLDQVAAASVKLEREPYEKIWPKGGRGGGRQHRGCKTSKTPLPTAMPKWSKARGVNMGKVKGKSLKSKAEKNRKATLPAPTAKASCRLTISPP